VIDGMQLVCQDYFCGPATRLQTPTLVHRPIFHVHSTILGPSEDEEALSGPRHLLSRPPSSGTVPGPSYLVEPESDPRSSFVRDSVAMLSDGYSYRCLFYFLVTKACVTAVMFVGTVVVFAVGL